MNAIEIRGLKKSFRGLYALDVLDMTVPVGAIYGFIGENGSGKSTTEKLICGLLHPNGGTIRLYGKDYTDAEIRAKIGVLEKIATHYGIIRQGKMVQELTAAEMESRCRMFTSVKADDLQAAFLTLRQKYANVKAEDGCVRVYDVSDSEGIVHTPMFTIFLTTESPLAWG